MENILCIVHEMKQIYKHTKEIEKMIIISAYPHLGNHFAELAFSHWVNEKGNIFRIHLNT